MSFQEKRDSIVDSINHDKNQSEDTLNPHIPQFIAKAPWYISQKESTLEHQRLKLNEEKGTLDNEIKKGLIGESYIKYRKGACTNCGSMTHQAHDCLERPRKIGAKWNNLDICPDEIIPQEKKTRNLDEKRDRWKSFEPEDYLPIIEQFEAVEALVKEKRAKKVEESLNKDEQDDLKIKDFDDTTFGSSNDKTRTNIRNLRIREDTAKYLRNLDLNSAFYDPKSRSMREDPFQKSSNNVNLYRGDNEVRKSGDVSKILLMEAFALNKHKQGESIHLQALPTRSEMLYKLSTSNKESDSTKKLNEISKKYCGNNLSNIQITSEDLPTSIYDSNISINRDEKKFVVSKYIEDEYVLNHTQIWGSYYDINSKKWGFRCCKQTCRLSKCLQK